MENLCVMPFNPISEDPIRHPPPSSIPANHHATLYPLRNQAHSCKLKRELTDFDTVLSGYAGPHSSFGDWAQDANRLPLDEIIQKPLNTFINYNGQLLPAETPVATAFNRSLRFGDGLFETMYWDGQLIRNLGFHLDRLFVGLKILQFDLGSGFSRDFVGEQIARLCVNTGADVPARIRLNVFREDGRLLLPTGNKPVFIIESSAIPPTDGSPLRLTIFRSEKKSTGRLSNLKSNNYLVHILAAQYAREHGFDDSILLNHHENICEASSSNLFFIRNNMIYTPALTEGCVMGTKRRELINRLPALGYDVEESVIPIDRLSEMDEVFITNAIRDIVTVHEIDGRVFSTERTGALVRLLNTHAV